MSTTLTKESTPQEVRAAWTKALRSGKYRQGTGCLKVSKPEGLSEYCCLGVLCDLAVPAGITTANAEIDNDERGTYILFGDMSAFLPVSVREWVGNLPEDTLITMNDKQNATFEEIATFIDNLPIPGVSWSSLI